MCGGSGHALWPHLILSSSPTAAHSRVTQPKFPSRAQQCTTASEEDHWGSNRWRLLWTPTEILKKLKTRPDKLADIMFLKMAPIPEYYPPSAGGSQRDVLGTLLCLRDWPLPTPSAGKYFGKQNAFRPVGANGSALAAASLLHMQTLAGKACCATSTCSKHHGPLQCLSNPRAALPGSIHNTKNNCMREMLKSFLWLWEHHLLCNVAFALEHHLPARPPPAPTTPWNKDWVYA